MPIIEIAGGRLPKGLAKCYQGLEVHDRPLPGDVQFVYHTYHGLLVYAVQHEHRVSCPPHDARILLGRFLRYNFTWGMLSQGMIFIPFLALGNYLAQRRSIGRQELDLLMGVEQDSRKTVR